jgi:hypothetical protein
MAVGGGRIEDERTGVRIGFPGKEERMALQIHTRQIQYVHLVDLQLQVLRGTSRGM